MPARNYIRPFWYALADFVTASLAWGLFYFLRKKILGEPFTVDYKFWLGVVFIPAGWLVIYGLVGAYHSVYRKSRLAEITNTFVCSLIGCIVLFFLFLVDDAKTSYGYYYAAFFTLFACHFLLAVTGRLFILTRAKLQLIHKQVRFNAIIVGTPSHIHRIIKTSKYNLEQEGYEVVGFLPTNSDRNAVKDLPQIGELEQLHSVIDKYKIELVVLAIDKKEQTLLETLVASLSEKDVAVKTEADTIDILSGSVRPRNVLGAPLVDLQTALMPEWQQNIKRVIDVAAAFFSLLLLSPLLFFYCHTGTTFI